MGKIYKVIRGKGKAVNLSEATDEESQEIMLTDEQAMLHINSEMPVEVIHE